MTGSIGGRGWDLGFFFIGGTVLALAAGAVVLVAPALVVPLWLGWLALVDGPHLIATYTRTYLDARTRRERAAMLLGSLAWLLPGFVALAAGDVAFQLYLVAATLWSIHHNARQSYGILAIYERHARAGAAARRRDVGFLYLALWGMFALFLLGHPWNQRELPVTLPSPVLDAMAIALAAAAALYLISVVRDLLAAPIRARRCSSSSPSSACRPSPSWSSRAGSRWCRTRPIPSRPSSPSPSSAASSTACSTWASSSPPTVAAPPRSAAPIGRCSSTLPSSLPHSSTWC
jgi:hypothetical protein